MSGNLKIEGNCEPRFTRVRETFAQNFTTFGETGAAVALYIDGRPVVDLWAGHADAARTQPFPREGIVNVYSTTKGITAICAHRLVEQGRLDLDLPADPLAPAHSQILRPADHRATRRATKKPLVPCTCGSVCRNSGRRACRNRGQSSPSVSSTSSPDASTTSSDSSPLTVQTE